MSARTDLLAAWEAWDNYYSARHVRAVAETAKTGRTAKYHPDNRSHTDRLLRAEVAYADSAGIPVRYLRDVCAAWRRAGYSRERALDAYEAGMRCG